MSEPALFDLPADAVPEPAVPLGRGPRRQKLISTRIAAGVHPLGRGIPLHSDAPRTTDRTTPGLRCGTCRWRVNTSGSSGRTWPKCRLPMRLGDRTVYPRDTGCEATDVRAWWPACRDHQPTDDE